LGRKELSKIGRLVNLFFEVKVEIRSSGVYIVYPPMYKEYARKIKALAKSMYYNIYRIVAKNKSAILYIVTITAAIVTIIVGIASLIK